MLEKTAVRRDGPKVLCEALAHAGVLRSAAMTDVGVDAVLMTGDRVSFVVVSTPRAADPESGRPTVVVAKRISSSERKALDDAGIGWLDQRGHLRFRHKGLWLDLEVPPSTVPASRRLVDPLAGPVVSGVSFAALLAHPAPLAGVRALARTLGVSPGGVSLAVGRLVDAGFLTRDHRAAVPGLFWEVADRWRPAWESVDALATPAPGLVAVGTRAAVALGASAPGASGPVELIADSPATFRAAVRSARHLTGKQARGTSRIALAPTSLGLAGPAQVLVDGHRVASPVIVAASVAGDPARGAEIVQEWKLDDRPW